MILQSKAKKDQQARDRATIARQNLIDTIKTRFRIYFPTHETVASSTGGPNCGGTICFQSKWYNGESFPRDLLRDCKSVRLGMLMHNKVCFIANETGIGSISPRGKCQKIITPVSEADESSQILFVRRPDTDSKDWAYIGSANCSESAWGKLGRDRSSKALKLNCRNWECGVVMPLRRTEGDGEVPVPMEMPGENYRGLKPWYHQEG